MIRWGEDLGAPAVVAVADVVTEMYKPTWNAPAGIILSVAGYVLGGYMRIGGQFTKNLGIAAAPWAMKAIYSYVKGGIGVTAPASGRLVMRPTGRLASSTIVSPGLARSEETVSVCKP